MKKVENWPPRLPANCPLSLHPSGYQARIAGKVRWIAGKVSVEAALAKYHRKAAGLLATTSKPLPEPRAVASNERMTLHAILNRWALKKRERAEAGDMGAGSFAEFHLAAKRINEECGHWLAADWRPEQTEALHRGLVKKYGDDFARRAIGVLQMACSHAKEFDWIDQPVRLGKIAGKLAARPARGMMWDLYTPTELSIIIKAAEHEATAGKPMVRDAAEQLHCMILMALNGGYGAKELSDLPSAVVDLDQCLIDHERGKTGAQHQVPLWPETVTALRKVLAQRPGDELVFRTREGHPWCRRNPKFGAGGKLVGSINHDNVAWRFNKLVRGLNLKKDGSSFYKLRHVHSGAAEDFGDLHAAYVLVGHALPGSRGNYVRVSIERLRKLAEYLRGRFIPTPS